MTYIRLGLCCQNLDLRFNKGIYTGRTVRLNTINTKGIELLIDAANKNLDDLAKILEWCKDHGIYVFRISSDLIPHASNPSLVDISGGLEYQTLNWCKNKLAKIGKLIKKLGIRVTFHPGQYNQVGTPHAHIFDKTRADLLMHAKILDFMDASNDSIIIIHGGGMYGDKQQTIERFKHQFALLPEPVRRRLVLENDETCYSGDDLLPICEFLNIPFLLDVFHYDCYEKYHGGQVPIMDIMPRVINTWTKRGIRMKFHLSEQGTGPLGAHSTIVKNIPNIFFAIQKKYNVPFDIMIEAKGKEVAVGYLYKKYPTIAAIGKPISLVIPKAALKSIRVDEDCECMVCK